MSNVLGLRIAEARQKAGLSQAELCERSGIAQTQISRYESGRAAPRRESIEKLAKALDVPLEWLLSAALEDGTGTDRGEFVFQPSPENLEKLKALSTLTGKSPDELVQQMFEELEARLQNSFKTTIHATMAPPVGYLKGGPAKHAGQASEVKENAAEYLVDDARASDETLEAMKRVDERLKRIEEVIGTAHIELVAPAARVSLEASSPAPEPVKATKKKDA